MSPRETSPNPSFDHSPCRVSLKANHAGWRPLHVWRVCGARNSTCYGSCLSREPVTGISKDSSAAGHYPDSFPISPCSTSMNAAYRARKNNGTECSSASWSMLFIACVVSQKPPRPRGALWYSCFLERESTMGSLGLLRPSPEGARLQEDLDCKWPWGFLFSLVLFCLLT